MLNKLALTQSKCTSVVILWTWSNWEMKNYFIESARVLCHHFGHPTKSLPLTFSYEQCKASTCQGQVIKSAPYWFKDVQVVFERMQSAHAHNMLIVDYNPHKKTCWIIYTTLTCMYLLLVLTTSLSHYPTSCPLCGCSYGASNLWEY